MIGQQEFSQPQQVAMRGPRVAGSRAPLGPHQAFTSPFGAAASPQTAAAGGNPFPLQPLGVTSPPNPATSGPLRPMAAVPMGALQASQQQQQQQQAGIPAPRVFAPSPFPQQQQPMMMQQPQVQPQQQFVGSYQQQQGGLAPMPMVGVTAAGVGMGGGPYCGPEMVAAGAMCPQVQQAPVVGWAPQGPHPVVGYGGGYQASTGMTPQPPQVLMPMLTQADAMRVQQLRQLQVECHMRLTGQFAPPPPLPPALGGGGEASGRQGGATNSSSRSGAVTPSGGATGSGRYAPKAQPEAMYQSAEGPMSMGMSVDRGVSLPSGSVAPGHQSNEEAGVVAAQQQQQDQQQQQQQELTSPHAVGVASPAVASPAIVQPAALHEQQEQPSEQQQGEEQQQQQQDGTSATTSMSLSQAQQQQRRARGNSTSGRSAQGSVGAGGSQRTTANGAPAHASKAIGCSLNLAAAVLTLADAASAPHIANERVQEAIRLAESAREEHRVPVIAERFRTRECRNFSERGACPYGQRCMFAHGPQEMRSVEQNLEEGLTSDDSVRMFLRAACAATRPGAAGWAGSGAEAPAMGGGAPASLMDPTAAPVQMQRPSVHGIQMDAPIGVGSHHVSPTTAGSPPRMATFAPQSGCGSPAGSLRFPNGSFASASIVSLAAARGPGATPPLNYAPRDGSLRYPSDTSMTLPPAGAPHLWGPHGPSMPGTPSRSYRQQPPPSQSPTQPQQQQTTSTRSLPFNGAFSGAAAAAPSDSVTSPEKKPGTPMASEETAGASTSGRGIGRGRGGMSSSGNRAHNPYVSAR